MTKIKQDKILELIPEIRKYYSFSPIIGSSEPTKTRRHYLSIIRQLTKRKYKLNSYDYRIIIHICGASESAKHYLLFLYHSFL